jgi:hypothetical protein
MELSNLCWKLLGMFDTGMYLKHRHCGVQKFHCAQFWESHLNCQPWACAIWREYQNCFGCQLQRGRVLRHHSIHWCWCHCPGCSVGPEYHRWLGTLCRMMWDHQRLLDWSLIWIGLRVSSIVSQGEGVQLSTKLWLIVEPWSVCHLWWNTTGIWCASNCRLGKSNF